MADISKTAEVKIIADDTNFQRKMAEVDAQVDALKSKLGDAKMSMKLDTIAANEKLRLFNAELKDSTRDRTVHVKVDADTSLWQKTIGGLFGSKLGGFLGGAGSGLGSGIPFVGSTLGAIGPVGGAAGVAGIASTGLFGIIPAIAAALMGAGAFGALAYPTISGFMSGNTALNTAQGNYSTASQNLDTAITKSPADWKAYLASISGSAPEFQGAIRLLRDQNAEWQNLPPSMQKALVALSDNKAALKILLPDQKTALDALLKEKAAWDGLTPAQQKVIPLIGQLSNKYDEMVAKIEPLVAKIAAVGLQIANKLLPYLLPFADVAGKVILTLLQNFDKFASSPGFKQFMDQMLKLSGPALLTIGEGLGRVVIAVGKLLEAMINPNGLRMLRIIFDVIEWTIQGIAALFKWFTPLIVDALKVTAGGVRQFVDWIRSAIKGVPDIFSNAGGKIIGILENLATQFVPLGVHMIEGLLHGLESVPVVGSVAKVGSGIIHGIAHFFGISSPSTLMRWHGEMIGEGLAQGIESKYTRVTSAATGLAAAAGFGTAGGYAAAGGGAGGGSELVMRFEPTGDPIIDAIGRGLRLFVRKNGGGGPNSAQIAFGQTA